MTDHEAFLTLWMSLWKSWSIGWHSSSASRHTGRSSWWHSTHSWLWFTIPEHVMSDTSLSSVFPISFLITWSTFEATHWEWFAIEHVGHTAFGTSFKHWVTHWAMHPLSASVVVFGVSAHWHMTIIGVIHGTAVERNVLVWIITLTHGTLH